MKKAAQKNKRRRKRGARRRGGSEPKVVKSAMRVVHPVCCGIDVHKDVIVCTIARSAEGTLAAEYEQRSFSTRWADLVDCRTWLGDSGCADVCMESTGKYWVPVYNVLSATCNVVVANPKYTRAIQGKKTDSKDATWIADLFRLGMVTASSVPPQDIRDAREISRYRYKLACMLASEKNRYQNCLTVSNSTLASVLSDVFGKTARAVVDRVVAGGDPPDEDECRELAKGRAKAKAPEIAEAVAGCAPNETQRLKMRLSSAHVDEIARMMEEADAELARLMEPHAQAVALVASVPGFTAWSAMVLLAEIGCDMAQFRSARHLCSWAGLSPRSNSSAGKSKSSHVMRAGTYLKPLVVQCALVAATRCKEDDYFARKYQRIKARRGHKRAIIAIARMMLVCIYNMLKNGETFSPVDREREERKEERRAAKAAADNSKEREAIELLASLGYDVSHLRAPA